MKKTSLRVSSLAGRIALASAMVYCSVASAGSGGGVIYFTGALEAPPFDVSVGSAPGARSATLAPTQVSDTSRRTTYVQFAADSRNAPNASVSLSVLGRATGAEALATSFSDDKGNIVQAGTGGEYHVGASGGMLSLRARDEMGASPVRVLLMTTYR